MEQKTRLSERVAARITSRGPALEMQEYGKSPPRNCPASTERCRALWSATWKVRRVAGLAAAIGPWARRCTQRNYASAGMNIFTLLSEGELLLRIVNERKGRRYDADTIARRHQGPQIR